MDFFEFIHRHRSALIMVGLGLIAGFLGGLLGIGGGSIIVPGLVFFFGLTQKKAHGTSLMSAFLISVAGIIVYAYGGFLNNHLITAIEMTLGGVAGALIGAKTIKIIHSKLLKNIFAILLVVVGIRMFSSYYIESGNTQEALIGSNLVIRGVMFGLTGVLTGFMSALLGIGGGMIMIPALVIVFGFNQKDAQAISLAVMVPTSFFGVILHKKMGNLEIKIGAWVGISAAISTISGAFIAARTDTILLKMIFGILLIVVAVLMIYKRDKKELIT